MCTHARSCCRRNHAVPASSRALAKDNVYVEMRIPINIRKKDFLLMLLAIGLQCTSFFSFSRLHFSSGNVTPRPVHTAFVPPLDLSRSSYYCSLLCTRQYSIIPKPFLFGATDKGASACYHAWGLPFTICKRHKFCQSLFFVDT